MSNLAYTLGTVAGILTACGVFMHFAWKGFKLLRKAFRMLDTVETVVSRELEHNHGGSMKDDLYGMAVGFGLTQRQVDDLEEVVYSIRRQLDMHLEENRG